MTQVEVDEVLGFVGDIRSEVPSNDAMPGWVILFVELFLDESGNIFFDVVFIKSLNGCIDGIILHLLGHVRILDNGLLVSTHGAVKINR